MYFMFVLDTLQTNCKDGKAARHVAFKRCRRKSLAPCTTSPRSKFGIAIEWNRPCTKALFDHDLLKNKCKYMIS